MENDFLICSKSSRMNLKLLLLIVANVLIGYGAEIGQTGLRNFDGYKVHRVKIDSEDQLKELKRIQAEEDFDFWSDPRPNGFTDIMASPQQTQELEKIFTRLQISSSIMVDNVEKLVEDEREATKKVELRQERGMNWNTYQPHDTINSWMDSLAASNSFVKVETIGKTTNGREIKVIKISTGENKPLVLIDGAFHAREWIGPAFTTYCINELVNNKAQYSSMLNDYDFHIIPVLNADGYEYSRTTDRMWRKTRSNHANKDKRKCFGVDPNRNFGHMYGGAGTSTDKCSEIYRGPNAFSEPETQALRDYVLAHQDNLKAYVTIHSYGQYWLTPWGYTSDLPSDYEELERVGRESCNTLNSFYGSTFTLGSSTNVLYSAAGGSDDWAYSVMLNRKNGMRGYSYTIEMRDTGKHGFVLPPEQIIPASEETWAAIQTMCKEMK